METCETSPKKALTSRKEEPKETRLRRLISLQEGFRKHLVSLFRAQGRNVGVATIDSYGLNALESCAKYDHATRSLRTYQTCLPLTEDASSTEFLATFPRSGMIVSGTLYPLAPLVRLTKEIESGLLPTPSGTSNHGQNHVMGRLDEWGGSSNPFRGTENGKIRCASFEEWMMGFPTGWTELTHCATPSCPKSPTSFLKESTTL